MINSFFQSSIFAGAVLSLASYMLGVFLRNKFKLAIFNPLLIAIAVSICVLFFADISYENYIKGADVLSYLLTPATVCLAIPLYEELELLKKYLSAILISIFAGTLSGLLLGLLLAKLFQISRVEYVTLIPKSITTAIGIGLSEELEGYIAITVAVIILTGVLGNIIGVTVCKIFKITHPISKGLAFGTAAHAVGTAKAIELGQIEGAMGGLAIAVCGVMTVILAPIFL